jgi:predicted  nucleic acid-binding Zn-ribbon protein
MNAVAAERETTPQIKNLIRKKEECQRKLPLFQATFQQAESRHATAEKKRLENTDPDKASDLLVAVQVAKASRDAAAEPLRVAEAQIVSLAEQIETATADWKKQEKARLLEEWRSKSGALNEQLVKAQTEQNELANSMMARLHALDGTFAHCLQHGNPNFLPGGDILLGNLLPSIEITDSRATATWLRVPNRIKN